MNEQMEAELADVLNSAAADAPLADDELLASVRRGRRNRRRRRVVVTAACAVVLAAVGTVATVRVIEPPADEPAVWSGDVPDLRHLKPPEQVWPKAVHRLPGKLPDGNPYLVAAVLGKDRYLVHPPTSMPGSLSILDAKKGTVRTLGTLLPANEAGRSYEAMLLGVTRDRVVWAVLVNPTSPQHSTEVWSARLDGTGQATRLTTLDGGEYLRVLALDGEAVYANRSAAPAGFYRLPLAGGAAVRVGDATGYEWLRQGAWVRSGPPDARQGELRNLATGQRLPWTAHSQAVQVECDPLLCVGSTADNRAIVQRLDGTGFRVLPYSTAWDATADRLSMGSVAEGRFGTGYLGGDMFVWDRVSGKAATARAQVDVPAIPSGNVLIAQWANSDGTMSVLDLAAIS